jgi:hypothetical protein
MLKRSGVAVVGVVLVRAQVQFPTLQTMMEMCITSKFSHILRDDTSQFGAAGGLVGGTGGRSVSVAEERQACSLEQEAVAALERQMAALQGVSPSAPNFKRLGHLCAFRSVQHPTSHRLTVTSTSLLWHHTVCSVLSPQCRVQSHSIGV